MRAIKTIELPEHGSREKVYAETGEFPESAISFQHETIIGEYEHLVPGFTGQLTMPMVNHNYCGDVLLLTFQRSLGGFLEVLFMEGLVTVAFLDKHEKYLDPEFGIKRDIRMNIMELYNVFYDLEAMMRHFAYAAGHFDYQDVEWTEEQRTCSGYSDRFYYGNAEFFGLKAE